MLFKEVYLNLFPWVGKSNLFTFIVITGKNSFCVFYESCLFFPLICHDNE